MKHKNMAVRSILFSLIAVVVVWGCVQSYYWSRGFKLYLKCSPGNKAELEKALSDFEYCSKLNPFNADYKNYAGRAMIDLGRYEEAINKFNQSLYYSPRSFIAHYRKAYALMKLKRYPQMVESLRTAISIRDPLRDYVRFKTEFKTVRSEDFMQEFRDQY